MPIDLSRVSSLHLSDGWPRDWLPVLAVGSLEQHCDLPLATDYIIVTRLAELACERLESKGVVCALLPPLPYGFSLEWLRYPGTLSLSPETFYRLVKEILESVADWGAEKAAIINGHGGNSGILEAAARSVASHRGIAVGVTDYWRHTGLGALGHACVFERTLLRTLYSSEVGGEPDDACSEVEVKPSGLKVINIRNGVGAYAPGYLEQGVTGEGLVEDIVNNLSEYLYTLWRYGGSVQSI